MRIRRTSVRPPLLSLALTALLAQASLLAQAPERYAVAPADPSHAPAIAFARTLVSAMMEESGTPGVSVAVGVDGRIIWSEGFGYADVENRVPVWRDTRFRIGSVSKPLTAAALATLYEAGRLDLDAPVQRYAPSFPQKRWPITTRELAGHLAGIRHYNGSEFLSSERYDSVLEGLDIFKDDTLLFEPGTRYSYSSYGWNLISAVIEGAAGEDFLTYMRESVIQPLGLAHTVADHTDSIIPQRTRFYDRSEDGRILNAPYVDNSYKWAGGGFLSTPEDLLRFAFAHLDGGFLRPETVRLLWTSQHTKDGRETGYGIGWGVATDEEGRVIRAAHGGGSIGGTTFLLVYPQEKAALAIVGNMTQAPTASPAALILDGFLHPESLVEAGAGQDISGNYTCSAVAGEEEAGSATLDLRGAPAGYWGRMRWGNGTVDRIIFSASRKEESRLVTVDGSGSLTSLRFEGAARGGKLTGRWASGGGSGSISCVSRQ